MTDPDDILVWPDGVWCYRDQLPGMTHRSDDYLTIEVDSEEWNAFDPSQPLKRWES